ncbi:MAG: outer membrane protein assembly factor BamA [Bacteroides sp.]|nr:outer membrane protein assembly factor BamA [Bacteroidales bacterium]MBD5378788.1 outer membrane protein assembly factor BamA [Bacteroides sp.]MDE5808845.1 outer membrane protein assembly factor BamA [Muribaculaceae bacterium]
MRYKLTLITLIASLFFAASAQERLDTIYTPNVHFTGLPRTYEIADIKVTGAPNYDDVVILGYSGLKPGQRIEIPGQDITTAVKRLMRQGLFAQARVKVLKTFGDRAWLELELRTNPRISEINYIGMKKSERDDIQERLQLMKGNQITRNVMDRAKVIIEKYYSSKGFGNAEVDINLKDDPANKNEVIVNISVNKHDKVKVHKIYIEGNEVLTDKAIKSAMKKTNENGNLLNLFKQKKFVEADYENDLNNIIEKYNEKGYRDAKILSDSVANYDGKTVDIFLNVEEGKKYYISDIDWVGNTVYTTEFLNDVLGIKPGEVYNQKLLNKRTTEDDDAVANLYMDNGYLFYQLVPVEKNVRGDSIDLEMKMFEGPQAKINRVIINGNDRLYEKVIRRELRVRPGELFSKRDLIRSAREIAQTGHFDPENMDIQPQPNEENGTVDILFNLASKANDQIEFSLGWGQTGIIGKLSLKFTNFSIKNMLYPSTYKGVIPQGEGQTFTISAQTNARYYQAYQVSFLDPWFGGRRPNSLQVSAYYSRQTGVNNSFYNSQWSNPYMYSGYGYGYGYGYGSNYSDYYQSSYENSYDPGKFIQMAGVTVGFGKRLSWPDDYFTFTAELSYNWYYLKNWEYLFDMNNGQSNALVLGLTLARNSIDNPLYTRSGSQFSVNLSLTPPSSLFSPGRNWEQLSKTQTNAAKQELYRWVEYWKLRFKSRTYTPLTDVDGKWTLVLMTRADFGLLGSYNKWLRSPFETFYVGGDGMTGSYTYATETIALRGYDNGQFTPWGREGYAYSRVGLELHFPFMLQPTTTIYGLAFVEAGNAWTSVKEFAPFNLKRSAGAGVRIYLPMVGMMGIDWAYGFDRVYGEKGGSHFHFILGQEF